VQVEANLRKPMSNSNQTRKFVSYFFITALALLFALEWGPGSRGCESGKLGEQDQVATVNGKPIPLRDFAREYVQQSENFRKQGVPSEMLKQFGVHKQVLDRMVNTELLAQAAEQKGLSGSDEDLAKIYRESPVFQKDGRFDHDTFMEYVRTVENTTEVIFEDKLRRQLAAQRMLQLVEAAAYVSDDEVHARYLKEGDAARITFVRFSPTMYADQVPRATPAQVEAWQKANEKAVGDFYEQNKFTYAVPEKVKARQLLVRLPAGASAGAREDARKRIDALRADVAGGKRTFADAARAASEDTETKDKGGDLGWVERLQLPSAFAEPLFALQPGQLTAAVETPVGYFLGTVEERKASEQRPLEAVRGEIAARLLVKERSLALAQAAAQKALAEVKQGKSLTALYPAEAKASGGKGFDFAVESRPAAKETGEFSASADTIPQLGAAPEAMRAIFGRATPGPLDAPVAVGDALAVVVVTERRQPTEDAWRVEKKDLTLQALKAKQFELRDAFLKSLKETGTVVTNEKSLERVVGSDS
jgi:peptidyl-prolyl cis-trans isomerase D